MTNDTNNHLIYYKSEFNIIIIQQRYFYSCALCNVLFNSLNKFTKKSMARYFSDSNSHEVNIVTFQFAEKKQFLDL